MMDISAVASALSPQARELLLRELVRAGTTIPVDAVTAEPVAVVGIGCRFPGNVSGPERFWELLADAEDAITEVPADRWDVDAFYDPDPSAPGRMTTRWGGFIAGAAEFDAEFFGITPREAAAMDPQQRVLLEVSWEALEHAGICPDSLCGTRTGVMMGLSTWDYAIVNMERRVEIDAYLSTGVPHSTAVGRLSYLLGLRGPAIAVDTACSSSLVALHLACQSLRLRESDLTLAGGTQLNLSPFTSVALSKWSALSPAGRCKTFDAGADGFVRGEGCGVVVLKRLGDALRDGDRVLAVVRGSAVNQDGRSNGITAPNASAQRDVITSALHASGVPAASVNYVEAHGTGTILGDPIEFEALASTYGHDGVPCALGAVKTNLGHLEAAAGVAGFIKAVLAVQRGQIPPNLHFTRLNPAIDASSTRFFFPAEVTPWPPNSGPRRAGVSSFGLAGTNAHVVIEQAPDADPVARELDPVVSTLVVTGKTPQRIASTAAVLADWMLGAGAGTRLADVAHTLNHHRTRHASSAAVCARDRSQAVTGLRALAAGRPADGVVATRDASGGPGTVFVYSGQGSQWAGMGRQLLLDEPAFAAAVATVEPVFVEQVGFSLHEAIAQGELVTGDARVQPVLMGLQLALTELLRGYGVTPDAVIGHSMGEVTAAVTAGALTIAEGLRVIAIRSRLMSRLAGQGAVALLELDADDTAGLIADYPDVGPAVYASPRQTVIAGPPQQIDELITAVTARNGFARRVNMEVASHTALMEPILPELRSALADLAPAEPTIPFISTVVESAAAPVLNADYWVANVRRPVRLHQAITTAADNHGTFVEISAHPTLAHAITETLESGRDSRHIRVISTMNRGTDQALFFHSQLAALGVTPGAHRDDRFADIPTTPWHHSAFWVPDRSTTWAANDTYPLLGVNTEVPGSRDHIWQADIGTDVLPWLADYTVHGQAIMPAAGFAEIVLEAGAEALGLPLDVLSVSELTIEHLLPLEGHTRLTTRLIRSGDETIQVEIHSRSSTGHWCRHAVAQIETTPDRPASAGGGIPLESIGTAVSPADFYAGRHLGPAFTALTRIVRLPKGISEAEIAVPDDVARYAGRRIHPVMLDAALQILAAMLPDNGIAESESSYLPMSFQTIRVFGETGGRARCRSELTSVDRDGKGGLGRITLTDDAGEPIAEITGAQLRRVDPGMVPLPVSQKVFDTTWVESPVVVEPTPPAPAEAPGSWLVLADDTDAGSVAAEFTADWRSSTRRVIIGDLSDEASVRAAFAEAAADPDSPPVGVVVFVDDHPLPVTNPAAALDRGPGSIWAVSTVVRAVLGGWHDRTPRLWLLTRRGLAVGEDEPGDPAIGALRGFIRVLAYEHPEFEATLVDLDADDDAAVVLTAETGSADHDDVIARRGRHRYVERLARATLGPPKSAPTVRTGGAYVITGGLGGLGLVVAEWLVDKGAGRVVLNARREPSERQRKIIADLSRRGEVVTLAGDIAEPGVADRLVAAAEATGRRLRGVVHASAVIADSLVVTMTRESLDRVWSPKAAGAVRLHEATAGHELDWWLAFSSTASLVGSPGQTAYATANAWVDAFVSWRRASGRPASVINWGPWSQVGVARALTNAAVDPITPAEGTEALECLLATGRAHTGLVRLRADRAQAAFPEIRRLGYFARVIEEFGLAGADDWTGPDSLRDLDPADAERVISGRVGARIAAIMGHADASALSTTLPLIEMGMDSLLAVRIRQAVQADFGVDPPVALLLQGAAVRDVAGDIFQQLGLTAPAAPTAAVGAGGFRELASQRIAARQDAAIRQQRGRGA